MAEIIKKYFPDLSEKQILQFEKFGELFNEWNAKINLVSRKDMDNFYERHVLHSLGIAKVIQFAESSRVMDVGTGGGLPGIPLAIMFPEVNFVLVDSIGKKIKAVDDMARQLGLVNVKALQIRAEEVSQQFDFITARAVTSMPEFHKLVKKNFYTEGFNDLPNGILYLKGGDLTAEIAGMNKKATVYPLSDFFKEDFFETKFVVHVAVKK